MLTISCDYQYIGEVMVKVKGKLSGIEIALHSLAFSE